MVSTCNWCWCGWCPLLIEGRCGRVVLQELEWPASVVAIFGYIGNWFPDIGKSSRFPNIGKSIADIPKSFPDIGKLIIRYREMLNENANGFPYISHSSRWCITSFLVQKIASQLHPGHISRSTRFKVVCHTSIQVLSHLHPGPNSLISPPSMSQHNPGPKLRVSPASISVSPAFKS